MTSDHNNPLDSNVPTEDLLQAKQAALHHYGRLVLLAEDAAFGRRSRRIQSSLAGVGVSDDTIRLYLYDSNTSDPEIVPHFNGIPTQIVRTPGFRPAPTTRHRPALGGVSIGLSYQRAAGTLGCLVEDAAGDRYMLTNNHVIADLGTAPIGSRVVQPATLDGGFSPRDDIAFLATAHPIDFHGVNRVDAAVGALADPTAVDPGALAIGPFVKPTAGAFVGQRVLKHGRTTAYTEGTVVDASFDGFVDYGPAGSAWFEDQVVVEGDDDPFSAAGDSGSLIVDDDRHPVALLFAGDDRHTLGNPIDAVLSAFGLTLV